MNPWYKLTHHEGFHALLLGNPCSRINNREVTMEPYMTHDYGVSPTGYSNSVNKRHATLGYRAPKSA